MSGKGYVSLFGVGEDGSSEGMVAYGCDGSMEGRMIWRGGF